MQLRDFSTTTINCLGDSTTWGDVGAGYAPGGPKISWPAHLQQLLGAQIVRNYGRNGSRVGMKADRDDSFVERFASMAPDADVVLVMGGVNDFNREVPLGTFADTDPHTYYGALHTLLPGLVHMYPAADIIYIVSSKSGGVPEKNLPPFNRSNGLGFTQGDYAAATREVCKSYSIPVIDLYTDNGISPVLPEYRGTYISDGLHFTPAGYERLARRIASELLRFIAF